MDAQDRLTIETELFTLLLAPQITVSVKKHLVAVFESFLMFENLDANGKNSRRLSNLVSL